MLKRLYPPKKNKESQTFWLDQFQKISLSKKIGYYNRIQKYNSHNVLNNKLQVTNN